MKKSDIQNIVRLAFKRSKLLKTSIIYFLLLAISISVNAAVFTVNNLGDANAGVGNNGDLRYCINQANLAAGPHTINFSVAGVITLTGNLPVFGQQITIDASTAPGFAGAPVVAINGNGATAAWGFLLNGAGADGSQFIGLAIYDCQFNGINSPTANNLVIDQCYIGVNLTGNGGAGNGDNGLAFTGTNGHTITNCVISNNGGHGIQLNNSDNATIQGNIIGLNSAGNAVLANSFSGIQLGPNSIDAIIGGAAVGQRNIISGNTQQGVELQVGGDNAQFINNYIGTDINGNGPGFGNGLNGVVVIASGANPSDNLIFDNNVISGNGAWGINIFDGDDMTITNNYVGVNAAGTTALPNGISVALNGGIDLKGSDNADIIDNVLSGNNDVGLRLENSDNVVIQGNKIGTNAAGTAALANNSFGMWSTGSDNMMIGGLGAGEENIYSGNLLSGGHVENATGVMLYGNIIGLDVNGTANLGNGNNGFTTTNITNLTVGGTTAAHRNIISGNTDAGIIMTNTTTLVFEGNFIGTDINGSGAVATFGNGKQGVQVAGNNTTVNIGGPNYNQRNIISGNGQNWFFGCGCGNGTGLMVANAPGIIIQGNFIGLDVNGAARGNEENGMDIFGSTGAIIGGSTPAERNIVSNQGYQGIMTNNCHNAIVTNNYCGTDTTGTVAMGNGQSGILNLFSNGIYFGRDNANEGNICSNNGEFGIHIVGGQAGFVYNNLIGTAIDGTTDMGNGEGGIKIIGVAGSPDGSGWTIGGLAVNQPNIIAYSQDDAGNTQGNGYGIGIASNGGGQGEQNTFRGNAIFCNVGQGVDLNFTGDVDGGLAIGNTGEPAPTLTSVVASAPNLVIDGTALPSVTIDFYANPEPCFDCQAKIWIGSYTVPAGGAPATPKAFTATFVPTIPLASIATNRVTAIATDASGNSSEISPCINPLPVTWLTFDAKVISSQQVALSWSTASEENNSHFIVERSADGENFVQIGMVDGAGNAATVSQYTFNDYSPIAGAGYYRLTQVDYDGAFSYSEIVAVNIGEASIGFAPNPAENYIVVTGVKGETVVQLINAVGQTVLTEKKKLDVVSTLDIDLSALSSGAYIIYVRDEKNVFSSKLIKK